MNDAARKSLAMALAEKDGFRPNRMVTALPVADMPYTTPTGRQLFFTPLQHVEIWTLYLDEVDRFLAALESAYFTISQEA